jgi:hypothetical protein
MNFTVITNEQEKERQLMIAALRQVEDLIKTTSGTYHLANSKSLHGTIDYVSWKDYGSAGLFQEELDKFYEVIEYLNDQSRQGK